MGKSREGVEYREYRTAAKCVECFVDTGNCDLLDLGELVQFLVVKGDTNATGGCWYAYQGA